MKTSVWLLGFLCIFSGSCSQNVKEDAMVVIHNEKLAAILPHDTKVEVLAEGFQWTEGPLWLPSENKLLFSDIPQNSVFEWTEKGGIKLYLKPSGYTGSSPRGGEAGSNGLILSPEGDLILCQHGDRRMARMNAGIANPVADFTTLAGSYQGKSLNSPNDAAYHTNGDLYFTDPPYGLERNVNDPAKELDFQGVFKRTTDGNLILLTDELSRPNGIAFSPDYSKLYVANSDPAKAWWMVYDVTDGGLLENGRILYDATPMVPHNKGLPDGMKVHPNGWIFGTGPGGVLVFTPEGEHMGTIMTGEATSNCAFNADYSALYITADDYLLRVKLKK